jgi:hypothetical protein
MQSNDSWLTFGWKKENSKPTSTSSRAYVRKPDWPLQCTKCTKYGFVIATIMINPKIILIAIEMPLKYCYVGKTAQPL